MNGARAPSAALSDLSARSDSDHTPAFAFTHRAAPRWNLKPDQATASRFEADVKVNTGSQYAGIKLRCGRT